MSRADVREDRRPRKEADLKVVGPPRPAADKLRALLETDADHRLDALELRPVGDRTMGRAFRKRIADHDFGSSRRGQNFDLRQLRAGHNHARRRAAGLADIAEGGADAERHRPAQLGIRQNDVRRLAAEFLGDALDGGRRRLRNENAGPGRARDRDHVDLRMRRHSGATTGPVPLTRLNTPGGQPASCIISANIKALSGDNSLGFNTTVQPAASAGRDLGCDLVERPIPGGDERADADRLAHDGGGAAHREEVIVAQDCHARRGHARPPAARARGARG